MRKFAILLVWCLFAPLTSHALLMRQHGEMALGVSGGYGFPQLGFWNSHWAGTHMNKSSKEYSFGLMFNTFLLDDLSLSTEMFFTYNTITLERNSSQKYTWEGHFYDINLLVQKYWFDFFYFGTGLYLRVPFHSSTTAPGFTGRARTVLGALIDIGVDMKIFDHFGLKIAVRSHLPFMKTLSLSKNQYNLWTFPINFIFAIEWII